MPWLARQFRAARAWPISMRDVVYDRYGPPDVLRVEEVPVPSPGDPGARRGRRGIRQSFGLGGASGNSDVRAGARLGHRRTRISQRDRLSARARRQVVGCRGRPDHSRPTLLYPEIGDSAPRPSHQLPIATQPTHSLRKGNGAASSVCHAGLPNSQPALFAMFVQKTSRVPTPFTAPRRNSLSVLPPSSDREVVAPAFVRR